jgi:hypothetical protein
MRQQDQSTREMSPWAIFQGQYVSLLLIVLVFTVMGVRRTAYSGVITDVSSELAIVGSMKVLEDPFVEGELSTDAKAYLEAVRQVVKNHDVAVSLNLLMPQKKYGQHLIETQHALQYLIKLNDFFSNVPESATHFSFAADHDTVPRLLVELQRQETADA